MYKVAINGQIVEGIPTPRLIEAGGGLAYKNKNIWYLYVPGSYESPSNEYFTVTIVLV
jgi:hypothetical protein